MKKLMAFTMAVLMAAGLAGCTGSGNQQTTSPSTGSAQTSETAETQTADDFQKQIFENNYIRLTVSGMSVLTDGNFPGRVGADIFIENKTDEAVILPEFTEIKAGSALQYDGYPMGRDDGDTMNLNEDGTGSFSHTWEIQDASGNTVGEMPVELSVSKELMDESIAAGIHYEEESKIPDSIEDTVITEDDWVRISLTDITCQASSNEAGYMMDCTLTVSNISGRSLLITSAERMSDYMGGVFNETDEQDFPAGAESVCTESNRQYGNAEKQYTVFVFDPDDIFSDGKDEYGIYYNYRGREYTITVSLENGELKTSCTYTETSEFAYCEAW